MAKIDQLSDSKVRIEIEVTSEQLDHGLEHAYAEIKDDVEVKGFRKGNVPQSVYEKKYGVESLYDKAINHVLQETYVDAVTSNEIEVVAQPKIDLDVAKVERGKGFTYVAEVAVKPDVTLGDYKGLKFEKQPAEVTDQQVDEEINKLLQQNAELVLKEDGSVEDNDTAIFDFEGFVDGEAFEGGKAENYELKIGSGQFIPGFEEGMKGMKPGEEREIKVTFPENYQAENLKGKDAVFKVKLHEIKVTETPELTEEFVKELDRDGIDTIADLKTDTKQTLKDQLEERNKNARIDFAVAEATKNATFNLPKEMIENEKNRLVDNVKQQAKQYNLELEQYLQFSGITKEDFDKNMMKDAEKSVSYNLVVEAIGANEDITASNEEVDSKYDELAKQYNMGLEQIKAAVNEDAVKHEVVYRKTIDFLVDNLVIE
ncbi:MAG: trigger factor [Candidatus Izimaplasma sp.]|nr:trigger factor [Candidatus Izimaplasma bacterium]